MKIKELFIAEDRWKQMKIDEGKWSKWRQFVKSRWRLKFSVTDIVEWYWMKKFIQCKWRSIFLMMNEGKGYLLKMNWDNYFYMNEYLLLKLSLILFNVNLYLFISQIDSYRCIITSWLAYYLSEILHKIAWIIIADQQVKRNK